MKYTPFYCEENIFHLARDRRSSGDLVLMISNTGRRVALACQKAGRGSSGIVLWDYHVVLAARSEPQRIIDPDSTLGMTVNIPDYLNSTFPPVLYGIHPELEPVVTVVTGAEYVRCLSTDRSHMKGPDGTWLRPPPPWPEIYHPETGNTLFSLVDGTHPSVSGRFTLKELPLRLQEESGPRYQTYFP